MEVEVEKELGFKTKRDIEEYGLENFTKKCVERVKKYSGVITEQSKRLGQWMDWDNSYYTLSDNNITSIWYFLQKCHKHGWIKEIYKPMPWCSRCGTSLSEHEMTGSYKEMEHPAIFFKLPLKEYDANILVWTTTPWTLAANVALAVNENLKYCEVKLANEDKHLILAKEALKILKEGTYEVIKVMKGKELEGLTYETCFEEIEEQKDVTHKIVLWDDVVADEGSQHCGMDSRAYG